jgi:hypothetical protein
MKTAYRFLVLLTAVWSTNVAIAGNFDVEIHCFPKRIDQSVRTASDGGVNRPGSVGSMTSRATPRQQSGSFSIDDFKPHEKKSFSTNPVELNKSNLVGHWHYESGAKPNAQDTLVG